MIVARTTLTGHSGAGIVLVSGDQQLPNAPLYVKYIKKSEEFRVHVARWSELHLNVIDVQRKARRHDVENPNWQVRNHHNGFVYVRDGIDPHRSVLEAAHDCLFATDLDFGAVDVIWNGREGRPYVLEINTAPGLEGTTVRSYADAFRAIGNV